MTIIAKVRSFSRGLMLGRRLEREMEEELRFHISARVEELVGNGISRGDAEARARTEFGSVARWKEDGRAARGLRVVDELVIDARYALRALLRSPTFTLTAVLSLALGIGTNSAVFSVIDALLLRRLPVRDPGDLVAITKIDPETGTPTRFTYREFELLRERSGAFEGMFAQSSGSGSLQLGSSNTPNAGERVSVARVSTGFFTVLGVKAALGRTFAVSDDRVDESEASVVLSHAFWQRRFGGDYSVIGRKVIVFRGIPFTIVGVAERGFTGIDVDRDADLWWPIGNVKVMGVDRLVNWDVTVMSRLRPNTKLTSAGAELRLAYPRILAELAAAEPHWNAARRSRFLAQRIQASSGATGQTDNLRARFTQPLMVLMAGVAVVLLIASANVAALLFARATTRRRELAVREALGSGRARLIRQLLVESLTLALLAGIGALALARFGTRVVLGYAPPEAALALDRGLTLHALGFTAAVVLASTLLTGVLPAFWSTKHLNSALKVGAGGARGVRAPLKIHRTLVASQIALSVVLLVAAGLFVRTLGNLRRVDPGFDKKHIVLVSVNRGAVTAPVARGLLSGFEAIPGVRSATFFANLGLLGGGAMPSDCPIDAVVATAADDLGCVLMNVGPRFFETTATQLVHGRTFAREDEQPGANVAIISEEMARRYFGTGSALGQRIRGREVVGVVKDTKYGSLRDESQRTFYAPVQTAWMTADVRFALRTDYAAVSLTNAVRAVVHDVTPQFEVTSIQSLTELAESTLVRERFLVEMSSGFGLLALLLACIGLYGTMSFAVARRTSEIGIRMALGARASTVVAQLMWETSRTVAIGGLVGLAAAVLVTRTLAHLLFGLAPTDPTTIAAALLLLAAAAGIAAYLPARWASRVEPLVALRCE